jgi:outer membrane biosynthesis protein TonB
MEATLMKAFAAISTTALLLIFGTAVPAFAQDEHHDQDAKPAQHEQQAKAPEHQEQAKPARQETQAKPATQQAQAKPDRQQEQQPSSAKQESRPQPAQQQQAKPAREDNQAKPAQHQQQAKATKPATQAKQPKQVRQQGSGNGGGQQHVQRTAADQQRQRSQPALRLSARSSSRIPDARFQSNFGRGHEFRIGSPRMVDGYSRFQYGGYWFGFVQPWPDGWYYTDDVYIDYIDGGYYLCNPSYPGDQIAVSVIL